MKEWKEYRMKDISKYIGSGTTPTSNSEKYYADEGFLWINTGDLNNGLVFNCKQKITEAAIKDYSTLRFYPTNTVLEAMYGATIGKVGLLQVPATVNQACCAIVPREELVFPKFILYYLIYYKDALIGESCGGTQPNVNQKIVANIPIKLPSFEVQLRISSCIESHNKCFDNRISLLNTKRNLFLRLKMSIINRAVTKGLNETAELKNSGIEWIGKIPVHWKCIRTKNILQLMKGKTPSDFSFDDSGLPYLNMDYLRDRTEKPILYPTKTEDLFEIEENEILVLWDGANAGEFLLSKRGYLGSTMALLKIDEEVYCKRYFYALLKSIESTSKYFANGTTIPHFDSSVILNYSYPVPPLSEQQVIATYLDEKCAKIDAAVANIEKQIDAMKRLKRAFINEVVTGKREV